MALLTKKITDLGEQEVPLYADDAAVIVTDTGGTPTTKKTKLGTLRRFMLGIASVGTLVFPEQNLTLGTAVTGTDAASADVTVTVAPGTGAGGPAAYIIKVPVVVGGATDPQTPTEAFRVQEVANATGREVAVWNPSGPVMGGIPANTAAAVLQPGDGARFATSMRVVRVANAPNIVVSRVNGSFSSPSQVLAGQDVGRLLANAFTDTSTYVSLGGFAIQARDNVTAAAAGSQMQVTLNDVGSASGKVIVTFRGGGTNIAELVSGQPTLRFISGSTQIAFRDSTNAADTFTVNAAGTTITAPVVTAAVWGLDPGGSELFRVGGSIRAGQYVSTGVGITSSSAASTRGFSGGTSVNLGGNAQFYGQSHATQANDIEFRSGTTVRGWWDDSASLWTFGGSLKFGDDASGTNVAASPALFRGPGSTGNATPAGYKWQISVAGSSGATVQSSYIDAMTLAYEGSGLARLTVVGYFNAANGYMLAGTQVVGARQSGVADATDATDVITRFNELLARLRPAGHGLISD